MFNKEEYFVLEKSLSETMETLRELFPLPEYEIGLKPLETAMTLPNVVDVQMIAIVGNPYLNVTTFTRRGFAVVTEEGRTVLMLNTQTPIRGLILSAIFTASFVVVDLGLISPIMIVFGMIFLIMFAYRYYEFWVEVRRCEKEFEDTHENLDAMGVEITKAFSGLKVELKKRQLPG